MALRTGMGNLVQRVRQLTGAGTAEWTAGTVSVWDDESIQNILDSNAQFIVDDPLTWRPQVVGGGTVNYFVANAHYRDL